MTASDKAGQRGALLPASELCEGAAAVVVGGKARAAHQMAGLELERGAGRRARSGGRSAG